MVNWSYWEISSVVGWLSHPSAKILATLKLHSPVPESKHGRQSVKGTQVNCQSCPSPDHLTTYPIFTELSSISGPLCGLIISFPSLKVLSILLFLRDRLLLSPVPLAKQSGVSTVSGQLTCKVKPMLILFHFQYKSTSTHF